MKLTEKFNLTSMAPQRGAESGLWMSLTPKEVADALASGTGPSIPDDNGTPTVGTIVPGSLVEMDSNGQAVAASSPDLDSAMPKMIFVVFAGNNDFSGSYVGDVLCFHGGARLETEQYVADSYLPGDALIASSGKFAKKAAANDGLQCVGIVGPKGLQSNGVLDVLVVQGSLGR